MGEASGVAGGEARMSDLEDNLANQIKWIGLKEPEREYKFAPGRKYRCDFAWPDKRLLVEVEGGIYTKQAHGSITGILRDVQKYNLAAELGYKVLRVTPDMIKSGEALNLIERAMNGLAND